MGHTFSHICCRLNFVFLEKVKIEDEIDESMFDVRLKWAEYSNRVLDNTMATLRWRIKCDHKCEFRALKSFNRRWTVSPIIDFHRMIYTDAGRLFVIIFLFVLPKLKHKQTHTHAHGLLLFIVSFCVNIEIDCGGYIYNMVVVWMTRSLPLSLAPRWSFKQISITIVSSR